MKTKIAITEGTRKIVLMGARNLFHSHAPQFTTRAVELGERVYAKATGEKSRWYNVVLIDGKTILTAD